jgi:hypothetical protein
MSDQQSGASGFGDPEYLGGAPAAEPGAEGASRSGPRWGLVAGAGAGVVAVVAAGGFGLAQLLSGSGSPADAVPANALAYVSVDLDPSASQKIAAIQMMRKFPALREELGLDARDDVRRWFFEDVLDDGCTGLTYEADVAPWIGDRMAVAAVPDQGSTVSPLVALQVSDQDAAARGLRALAETCGEGEDVGVAFVGDHAVLMEEQADADSFAAAAEASPLSGDADYRTWTDRIGDPGVVNAYVSAEAPARMTDLAAEMAGDAADDIADGSADDSAPGEQRDRMRQDVVELYRDFEGAAGTLRFADGTLELAMTTKGMPGGVAAVDAPGAPALGDLPASTAAAFTVSFPDGWLQDWMTSMGYLLGGGAAGGGSEDLWKDLEAATGLQLPEDIETLLGDGLRVSVDSSLDTGALQGPEVPAVPVGIRINGDAAEIDRVLDILLAQVPAGRLDALKRTSGDGYVVLGLDQAYVDTLASGGGGLADDASFRKVVPEADRVSGGVFVNFDAGDWATRVAGEMFPGEPEVKANVAPLDALGLSSWLDDDQVQHGSLVLSTD